MVVNVTERTTTYINRIEKLAQQENMSLDDALAYLIEQYVTMLRTQLKDKSLSQTEKRRIFEAIVVMTPTGDDLGVDMEKAIGEISEERSEFNKEYYGVDFSEHVKGIN